MVRLKRDSSEIENKAKMPTFTNSIQHSTGSSSQCDKVRKMNERDTN
jgi:hypothetical protein